jgi:D,D-heptose 1,7-bisphosphate phosphatase
MPEKAIFLDRDDTLIDDPGYINHPDQVMLLDGVAEALIELRAMGYKLVIVSNQSAIARGIVTEKGLADIHERLKEQLKRAGAQIDAIYYCPYHPDGAIDKYRKDSDMRKPGAGMLLEAANDHDIDLTKSWMIGDSSRDIEAGSKAGCKTILLDSSSLTRKLKPCKPKPDHRAVNMKEAVNIIKNDSRKPRKQDTPQSEEKPAIEQIASNTAGPVSETGADRTDLLLREILEQLKRNHRTDMFEEFRVMRFLAGIVQFLALACLFVTIWFLMGPKRTDASVLTALAFAAVLQLMSLTFYVMQEKK